VSGSGEARSGQPGDLAQIITEIREANVLSLSAIASELTARGIPTARGASNWTAMQVKRAFDRLV
jgi:hypothetical protein